MLKHSFISGLFTLSSKVSCCGEELGNLLRGFWRMLIQFTSLSEGEEELMHKQSWEMWGGEKWKTEIFWGIYSYMWDKPVDEKEESDVLKNEWKEGARLVYRFRSTFSWKADSCCFPLSPCLTVWIHYAFRRALVQKSALNPPCTPCQPINWTYIYYFDLSFAGEWLTSKWILSSFLCKEMEVSFSQCERQTAERQSLGQQN